MTVTFECSPQRAAETAELTDEGKFVRSEEQKTFRIIMPIRCVSSDRAIDVSVNVCGHVARQKVAEIEREKQCSSVALVVFETAIEQLPRVGAWQFYEAIQIPVSGDVAVASTSDYEIERVAELNESLAAQLTGITKLHAEGVESFKRAKDFLFDRAHSLPFYGEKAREAAEYVARCMRSDGYGFLYGWNREKSGGLLDAVDDILGRKNMGHPNYIRAAEKIQSVVYRAQAPTVWSAPPPWGDFKL